MDLTSYIDPITKFLGPWAARSEFLFHPFPAGPGFHMRHHYRLRASPQTPFCRSPDIHHRLHGFCLGDDARQLLSRSPGDGAPHHLRSVDHRHCLSVKTPSGTAQEIRSKGLTTGFALWASGFTGLSIGGGFYTGRPAQLCRNHDLSFPAACGRTLFKRQIQSFRSPSGIKKQKQSSGFYNDDPKTRNDDR